MNKDQVNGLIVSLVKKYEKLKIELDKEREKGVEIEKALQSVAFFDEPEAENPEYWQSLERYQVSTTLANDTLIARRALEKYRSKK